MLDFYWGKHGSDMKLSSKLKPVWTRLENFLAPLSAFSFFLIWQQHQWLPSPDIWSWKTSGWTHLRILYCIASVGNDLLLGNLPHWEGNMKWFIAQSSSRFKGMKSLNQRLSKLERKSLRLLNIQQSTLWNRNHGMETVLQVIFALITHSYNTLQIKIIRMKLHHFPSFVASLCYPLCHLKHKTKASKKRELILI